MARTAKLWLSGEKIDHHSAVTRAPGSSASISVERDIKTTSSSSGFRNECPIQRSLQLTLRDQARRLAEDPRFAEIYRELEQFYSVDISAGN
jgi:hypothetical protein